MCLLGMFVMGMGLVGNTNLGGRESFFAPSMDAIYPQLSLRTQTHAHSRVQVTLTE